MRFPCLLALNKADMDTAAAHIAKLRGAYPQARSTVLCAKAEYEAFKRAKAGDTAAAATLEGVATRYPAELTGARAALNAAVALRPPLYAFPTTDSFDAVARMAMCRAEGGAPSLEVLEVRCGVTLRSKVGSDIIYHGKMCSRRIILASLTPPWYHASFGGGARGCAAGGGDATWLDSRGPLPSSQARAPATARGRPGARRGAQRWKRRWSRAGVPAPRRAARRTVERAILRRQAAAGGAAGRHAAQQVAAWGRC